MCTRFSIRGTSCKCERTSVNSCLFKSIGTLFHLGGGFKYLLFSPLAGEMIQFDYFFANGLKPPTSSSFVSGHVPVIARKACFSDIETESTESAAQ